MLQVGQRVRVRQNLGGGVGKVGEVGVIKSFKIADGAGPAYVVEFTGSKAWFFAEELEAA